MRAIGIHLVQDMRSQNGPARSAVAELTPDNRLSRVSMCVSDEDIEAAVGPEPALVLIDAPVVIPDVAGRRDPEHVLAWLDIPAFPVTQARIAKVHGGARGVPLAAALTARGHLIAEALPDQVLRQLLWERAHPAGSAPLDLGEYRAAWLDLRPPAFRPRGGRARNDGLGPARALLGGATDLAAWPTRDRPGDLGDLDEAAVIDAVACGALAWRCLHAAADRWAVLGDAEAGRVVLAACPEMITRARTNITRLAGEGTVRIGPDISGGDTRWPPGR